MSSRNLQELEKKLKSTRLSASAALDERVQKTLAEARSAAAGDIEMNTASAVISTTPRRPRTWLSPGLLMKAAGSLAAACLLAGALVWTFLGNGGTASAYAFLEEVVENSKAAEWVRMVLEIEGKECEIWFSFRPFRNVTKDGLKGEIRFEDGSSRKVFLYNKAKNTILIRNLTAQPLGHASLFDWIAESLNDAAKRGNEIVETEGAFEGRPVRVLTVKGERDTLTAHVDREQKRIVHITRRKEGEGPDGGTLVVDYAIDYPETGPTDIYEAGAPRDATIDNRVNEGVTSLRENGQRARDVFALLARAAENSKASEWVHWKITKGILPQEHWISFRPRRHFMKRADRITCFDYVERRHYLYDVGSQTLSIQPLGSGTEIEDMGQNFFEYNMSLIEREKSLGAEVTEGEEIIDGKAYKVVGLTTSRRGTPYHSSYIIDPDVMRIIRVDSGPVGTPAAEEGAGASPMLARSIDFDYPESGPEDVYALGVPRDARIAAEAPAAVKALKEKVEAARARFAPSYYAIVYRGSVSDGLKRKGVHNPYNAEGIDVIYKKNGRYRLERYSPFVAGESMSFDERRETLPPEDFEALEAWVKTRPLQTVYFAEGDTDGGWEPAQATRVFIDKEGTLQKETHRLHSWYQFAPEELIWDFQIGLSGMLGTRADVLPEKDGGFGRTVGIQHTRPGRTRGSEVFSFPERKRRYYSPDRDYVCEQLEMINDAQAPWQEATDWLEGLDADEATRTHRREVVRKVLEYARTPASQWYARKIQWETKSSRYAPSQRIAIIHLDTTREIPDELFDPASIDSPDLFPAKETTVQWHFAKAIAEVDAREHWPETPEEVSAAYWRARNAKDFQEMAVLWPGSGSWHEKALAAEEPTEYVFDEGRVAASGNYYVPYCSKRYHEENGRFNLKMVLRNDKSEKGRWYITSGN